jgi:DNA repair ATPase RecN
VHTPFDGEKKFGEDIRGAIEAFKKADTTRLAQIAERFVKACRAAADGVGLDLVALTDHNSIEGYRRLRPFFDSIAQRARDAGSSMPAILPGVEFSVGGERPLHFLVIFGSDTKPDDIDKLSQFVFGAREPFDPKTGTPRATGESVNEFLKKLYEFCRPPTGERHLHFVLLPAHADGERGVGRETGTNELGVATGIWEEMKGHLRQWTVARTDWNGFETARAFDKLPQAFRELLLRWAAARRGEDWDRLTDAQKNRYREQRHWALVECSDPHRYEAIGTRYAWLKMEVPDVEGIRLALLDPESRLRRMADGPPGRAYPRVERLQIRNTDFFEDIEIPFNPCLTTLIGGRGSGKSTVAEYLRYAFDRARPEDFPGEGGDEIRTNVEALLALKRARDYGETPGTLLPGWELKADLVVAERRYRVQRAQEGLTVVRDPDTASAQLAPLEVRSLVAPRILSQRQIARIARDPASQRSELDALLDGNQLRQFDEERRQLVERLTQLQATRARLKERRKTLPARQTELQKINDQIAFLEASGGKEILARFDAYQREEHWLNDALLEVGSLATTFEEQAVAARDGVDRVGTPPAGTSNENWLRQVSERLKARFEQAAAALRNEATSLGEFVQSVRNEQQQRWQPGFQQARQEYDRLREEMKARGVDFTQHEKLLQQRALLQREVEELRRLDEEIGRTEAAIGDTRGSLVRLYEVRLELRRQQAGALEALDADVRLEVLGFRDRKDFESRREEWFAGAGLQERDWTLLVEYVFASSGSVPDRIAGLATALRKDIEQTQDQGRAPDPGNAAITALLGVESASLTKFFFRALERAGRIRLDEMERFLPEDAVEAKVRGADGILKPITTGSVGERSTAILSLLLSAGNQPLIIDQPEDDLDNRYVYDVVVSLLRRRKFSRQIIIATHNANIPVNGDAELIVALGTEKRFGIVLASGSIDRPDVKEQVSVIMEGSAEAFRLRSERYGY